MNHGHVSKQAEWHDKLASVRDKRKLFIQKKKSTIQGGHDSLSARFRTDMQRKSARHAEKKNVSCAKRKIAWLKTIRLFA